MIRKATLRDVRGIYDVGLRAHALSHDASTQVDEIRARTHIAGLIASTDGLVLVDEVDGCITGVLLGFVDTIWYSKRRFALSWLTYAERRGAFVWMVKRFKKWALVQKRVAEVVFDASFGGDLGKKTETILPKLGFELRGGTYIARGDE